MRLSGVLILMDLFTDINDPPAANSKSWDLVIICYCCNGLRHSGHGILDWRTKAFLNCSLVEVISWEYPKIMDAKLSASGSSTNWQLTHSSCVEAFTSLFENTLSAKSTTLAPLGLYGNISSNSWCNNRFMSFLSCSNVTFCSSFPGSIW